MKPVTKNTNDRVARGVSVKPVTKDTSGSVTRGVSAKPVAKNTSGSVTRGVSSGQPHTHKKTPQKTHNTSGSVTRGDSVKLATNKTSDSVTRGVSVKPGECPVPQAGVTVRRCDSDGDCDGTLKCCTEGRGHVCRYPVYGEYGTREYPPPPPVIAYPVDW